MKEDLKGSALSERDDVGEKNIRLLLFLMPSLLEASIQRPCNHIFSCHLHSPDRVGKNGAIGIHIERKF
jgi:hypothetical protein